MPRTKATPEDGIDYGFEKALDRAMADDAKAAAARQRQVVEVPEARVYRVPSKSEAGWFHRVTVDMAEPGPFFVSCTCPGFRRRGKCRHIDAVTEFVREEVA